MKASPRTQRHCREEAIDWFLKKKERPDDATFLAKLDAWLAEDERHAKAYEQVRCLMGDANALLINDRDFAHRAGRRDISPATKGAIAVFAGAALIGGIYSTDISIRLRADVVSSTAERKTVTAPDGSTLTLNARSAIAYDFSETERRVTLLRGEVFAEVSVDPKRPFTVATPDGETTALGTAFNVNMLDDLTSVTVQQHSVLVTTNDNAAGRRLEENQSLDYSGDGEIGTVAAVDPMSVASWRAGRFIFEDKPLTQVIETFERYLPGNIVITHEKLRGKRLSGNFDMTDPEAALNDLALAFDIGVTRVGPYLTILY